jgi:hypothetical protein
VCSPVLQADDPESGPVLDVLGVEVLPTVQFWREGKLLWEHRGVNQLEQNMGEGVLYFGDRCAGALGQFQQQEALVFTKRRLGC